MIKVGTVFSGIGAVEHALDLLGIAHEIEFACDNGERKLKTSYDEILEATKNMSNAEKDEYVLRLYDAEAGINYVEQSYRANYPMDAWIIPSILRNLVSYMQKTESLFRSFRFTIY